MVFPKYYDSYHITRSYQCPCGHAFVVERKIDLGVFPGVTRDQDE